MKKDERSIKDTRSSRKQKLREEEKKEFQ